MPGADVSNGSALDACRMVALPQISDARGHLTFIEARRQVPFAIERVYYLYGVPPDAERGGHAYRALEQVVIPLAGQFEAILTDGRRERRLMLDRPDAGLYLHPRVWRRLAHFSPGAVCLVLASRHYDQSERENDFERYRGTAGSRSA